MSPTDYPLVSAIIPTFNRSDLIGEAIQSVLSQTYPAVELIVVDDASTEDLTAAIAPWADRLRYLRRASNGGRAAAINDGVKLSSGDFIAVLDSDDVWKPRKLELQMDVFRRFPECGGVGGGAVYFDLDGHEFGKPMIPAAVIDYRLLVLSLVMPGCNSNEIVRRDVFDAVGGYDVGLRRAQDYDFWLKLARVSTIRMVPEVLTLKRAHTSARPDADIHTLIRCRQVIASRIPEPEYRRKHSGWMWFHLGRRAIEQRRYSTAIQCFLKSFWVCPRSISPKHRRIRSLLWMAKTKIQSA